MAEVTVTAGEASVVISVNQLPSDSEMAHYRLLNKFNYGAVVSPNGRYAGGSYQTRNNDDTYNYHVVIIDLETEEWHEVGEFHSNQYKPTIPSCITDDGTLFSPNTIHTGIWFPPCRGTITCWRRLIPTG